MNAVKVSASPKDDLMKLSFNPEQDFPALLNTLFLPKVIFSTGYSEEENIFFKEKIFAPLDEALANFLKTFSSEVLLKVIMTYYFQLIEDRKLAFKRLGYRKAEDEFSMKSTIAIWVELEDNDFETKGEFYLAGATINSLFFEKTKIYIDTSVLYERHHRVFPNTFKVISNVKTNGFF